jgi:hypothetical protein
LLSRMGKFFHPSLQYWTNGMGNFFHLSLLYWTWLKSDDQDVLNQGFHG